MGMFSLILSENIFYLTFLPNPYCKLFLNTRISSSNRRVVLVADIWDPNTESFLRNSGSLCSSPTNLDK